MINLNDINQEFLKLALITYGGELYSMLENYKQKEILLPGSKIEKTPDIVMSKKGDNSFFSYKNEDSGFVANVFENIITGDIVIAFRGTERINFGENILDYMTWGKDIFTDINLILGNFDQQFTDAFELYEKVKEQAPKAKITILGHSLGGGLAQLVAAKEYTNTYESEKPIKLITYTYNAPGCKQLMETIGCNVDLDYSFITNYAVMNDWCGMFGENIGETYLIAPIPLKEQESTSPSDILNNILLTTHEGIFEYAKKLHGKIIKKPKDFNQSEGLSLWYFDKNNPIKDVDTMPEFINAITHNIKIPQIDAFGKTIKEATEKFISDNDITLPKVEFTGIKTVSNQIKEAAENFIDEQKEKLSQIEVPQMPDTIKEATANFLKEQVKNREKFLENINNNIVASLTKLLEATVSQVSVSSLQSALDILKREAKELNNTDYIEYIKKYIVENKE